MNIENLNVRPVKDGKISVEFTENAKAYLIEMNDYYKQYVLVGKNDKIVVFKVKGKEIYDVKESY